MIAYNEPAKVVPAHVELRYDTQLIFGADGTFRSAVHFARCFAKSVGSHSILPSLSRQIHAEFPT